MRLFTKQDPIEPDGDLIGLQQAVLAWALGRPQLADVRYPDMWLCRPSECQWQLEETDAQADSLAATCDSLQYHESAHACMNIKPLTFTAFVTHVAHPNQHPHTYILHTQGARCLTFWWCLVLACALDRMRHHSLTPSTASG